MPKAFAFLAAALLSTGWNSARPPSSPVPDARSSFFGEATAPGAAAPNPITITVTSASGPERRHRVGDLLGGGVVFHVDETGRHGLICSLVDLGGEGQRWGNVWRKEQAGFDALAELAKSETDGKANTALILKRGQDDIARLCADYINADHGTGIHDDWHLPSIEELKLLHRAKSLVNAALAGDGNPASTPLQDKYYWSSTEQNAGAAFALSFFLGATSRPHKSYYYWVRAIRSF